MNKIFFDTETTGLKPGQIGQLAYIIQTDNNEIIGKNHYFEVGYVEEGAAKVTGMDTEFYKKASCGQKFADRASEIASDFNDKLAIAHNIEFDKNFMSIEMFRADTQFCLNNTFDTMEFFRDMCKIPDRRRPDRFKNPKLIEVIHSLNIDEHKIELYSEKVFNLHSGNFHNAMYDATALMIMFNVYGEIHNSIQGYWRDTFVKKGGN